MKKIVISILAIAVSAIAVAQNTLPLYLDESAPLERRIDDAISRMTLEEKIRIIHAQSKFSSAGVPRLGIPELWTTDGPHGIRPEVKWDEWEQAGWTNDSCVAFPALTALAATWNTDISHLYGKSIGEEARYRNKSILLGPGVNIYRTPLNGRNFEYMGEDPYLAGEMVVPYIQGVQENGVATCVKHYALNNQELHRHTTNVNLSERALYEIYLPAFKAAVQRGKTWSIMGAYNLYNNEHACHNSILLNKILKEEWGFDGVVVSDWGGTHDTYQSVVNGLDLEFGTGTDGLAKGKANAYDYYYLANPYLEGIRQGKYTEKELNDKVRRVLRLIMRTAMNTHRPFGAMNSEAHIAAARAIGNEGIVLLKNDGNLLPLNSSRLSALAADGHKPRILVVGENAIKMMTVGGGSSSLKVQHEISPLAGLREAYEGIAEVSYVRGYVGDVGGEYNGVVSGQNLRDSRSKEELIAEAVKAAREADVVIFFGGLNKSNHQDCEDTDRESLGLPYAQDELITALQKANSRLVVCNISGNAVAMPWASDVPSIMQTWYLGSEAGHSIADVISGKANPSGKLPMTFYANLNQCGAHALNTYPGTKRADGIYEQEYSEDILVGYRYVEKKKQKPLFAFGHGLSYTTFGYGKATMSQDAEKNTVSVSIPLSNTGAVAGAETLQLYVEDVKASVMRPVKELKAFRKVMLQPGETRDVTFTLGADAFSYYDSESHSWVMEPGTFRLHIGTSSANIIRTLTVKK